MKRRRGRGGQPSTEILEEEEKGTWGTITKKEMKETMTMLHILNDLAKGQNEMKETFSKGKRELIDTLTQLLIPLGNI
jgi:hypothetical protein